MASQLRRFTIDFPSISAPPLRTIPPDFLSFTIDTSLLLGGHWWGESRKIRKGVADNRVPPLELGNEQLAAYARALRPAMLRIGGTEADRVGYKLGRKALRDLGIIQPSRLGDSTHEFILKKCVWKRIHKFLDTAGLSLLFTLSAGPSDRDETGAWIEDNAQKLIAYSVKKGNTVAAWELGNEVNGFPFIYGWKSRVGVRQYAKDFARFGNMVRKLSPKSKIIGPASAVWPRIGEPNPLISGLCRSPAAGFLDAVSWHYYPQQSSHGRIATKRAGESTMLNAGALNGVLRWNARVLKSLNRARESRSNLQPTENWVTETAHALYGGESGLSDSFVSTLWWLDELGLLAREGVDKLFRQALVGAHYGLLDQTTFEPRPDYFASFLWKKLMGEEVLELPIMEASDRRLRAYHHRRAAGKREDASMKRCTILLINLDRHRPATILFSGGETRRHERYLLQGDGGLQSKSLLVNGIRAADDLVFAWGKNATREKYRCDSFPADQPPSDTIELPPVSALFLSTQIEAPEIIADGDRKSD